MVWETSTYIFMLIISLTDYTPTALRIIYQIVN